VPQPQRLAAMQASEQLAEILVRALEQAPYDVDAVFTLLEDMAVGNVGTTPSMRRFLYRHIISSESIELWQTVFQRCLDIYSNMAAPQSLKRLVLHDVAQPILAMDATRRSRRDDTSGGGGGGDTSDNCPPPAPLFMDKKMVEAVTNQVWRTAPEMAAAATDAPQAGADKTHWEVLQLSASLVKYYHDVLHESRKDIIKFGWTFIRNEEPMIKSGAYVVIAYFIAFFDTPAKIVNQVFLSLLKFNQTAISSLVEQALYLIVPVLPLRCGAVGRNVPWTLLPRRILAEEWYNAQQITFIFHFLALHGHMLYENRDKYMSFIVSGLQRITPHGDSIAGISAALVFNIFRMLFGWEQRRL